jgi:hypothetical protein
MMSQVHCKICDENFSISHGEEDVMRHAADPIHKMNVVQRNTNKLMIDFVMTKLNSNTDKATAAECTEVYHTVHHEH